MAAPSSPWPPCIQRRPTPAAIRYRNPTRPLTHAFTHPFTLHLHLQGYVPAIPLPKYFNSEWSFAQFRLHEEPETHHQQQGGGGGAGAVGSIVGFGAEPHTVLVVTAGGSFYKVAFDPVKGGHCTQLSYCKFLERHEPVM